MAGVSVLALVTDAFGGVGGIARYNRDILNALARCAGNRRVVVLPRHGSADQSGPPPGVRQLPPKQGKLIYALAAFHAALTEGPFEAVFCGHLHMAPLGAAVARMLGVPFWLQLHGVEAWDGLAYTQRWAARRAALITAVSRHTRRRFLR